MGCTNNCTAKTRHPLLHTNTSRQQVGTRARDGRHGVCPFKNTPCPHHASFYLTPQGVKWKHAEWAGKRVGGYFMSELVVMA